MTEKQGPRYPFHEMPPQVRKSSEEAVKEIFVALGDKSISLQLGQFLCAFKTWCQAYDSGSGADLELDMLYFCFTRLSDAVRPKAPRTARYYGRNWDAMFCIYALGVGLLAQGMAAKEVMEELRLVCPPWLKTEYLVIDGTLRFNSKGEFGEFNGMPSTQELEAAKLYRVALDPKKRAGRKPGTGRAVKKEMVASELSRVYWDLMEKNGKATIEDVAEALWIEPGTIYKYRGEQEMPWPPPRPIS